MNPYLQVLISLATGLILSVVTAILTVRLSLRQFYSQRWWEKKSNQYEKILEALYNLRHASDRLRASVEAGKDLSPERKKLLVDKSHEGSDEIERARTVGAFAISKEAVIALKQLRECLAHNDINKMSYYEYLDNFVACYDKCIAEIIALAQKDLQNR